LVVSYSENKYILYSGNFFLSTSLKTTQLFPSSLKSFRSELDLDVLGGKGALTFCPGLGAAVFWGVRRWMAGSP